MESNASLDEDDYTPENINFDYHQDIARSAFADMLHDTERNQKYYMGIKAAVERMHRDKKKANVLDIGTGTGLLSMMAVKCGADSVTACEAFEPVAECTKEIIKLNGFSQQIKLITKNSMNITVGDDCDMEERANILVTEIFDTELIGEGAISIFAHAHKELLVKDDSIVVPNSATIYAQVVESPLAFNWHKFKSIVNTDDGCPIIKIPELIEKCAGSTSVHDIQLSQFPLTHFKTIISPTAVLRFDWSGKTQFLKERSNLIVQKAEQTGTAQAVFMWWELLMDIDGKVSLSCAPYWAQSGHNHDKDSVPWRDHWMQAIYYLPEQLRVVKDQELTLISSHDEYSLWFNLKTSLNLTDTDYLRSECRCGLHTALSRTRIGQINDSTRVKKYLSVLEQIITSESICLCLSDASLLAFVAAKLGAKKVYCISEISVIQQALNEIALFNGVADRIVFLQDLSECREKKEEMSKVGVVIGEPFFVTSLLPWDNLYFMHALKEDLCNTMSPGVKVMPTKCVLNAMAVNFNHLHKIKEGLQECEGFNVQLFSDLVEAASARADAIVEPQPLWEYPGRALSLPTALLEFDVATYSTTESIEHVHPLEILTNGVLNGIAIWTDWCLDKSLKNKITTGPIIPVEIGKDIYWDIYSKQGVYLLRNSIHIQPEDVLYVKIYFKNETMRFEFQLNNDDI